jgi:lysophospholipase L1-like esterase
MPGRSLENCQFTRYVALGDSQTEGVGDPDGRSGLRGWADRFADRLVIDNPGLQYANLAVRGWKVPKVRAQQLPRALAMKPDLASVVAGMNDLMRPRFDMAGVLNDIEAMVTALIEVGAKVITFTYPDIGAIAPVARPLSGRIHALNKEMRALSARIGATLIDFEPLETLARDPRVWTADRVHLSPLGHDLCAHAVANTLGVTGADSSWREPLPERPAPGGGILSETFWVVRHFAPWVGRRLRGVSSGDRASAKRPELLPVG